MARDPIPTWYFALVVIEHDGRFLIIQERKHQQKWYLPAGRVEPGESFVAAARREAREEAGIDIALERVVRVEHRPLADGAARMRVVFLASPADASTIADVGGHDALAAAWVSVDELCQYSLRDREVEDLFRHVSSHGETYPLGVLTYEGAPYAPHERFRED